MKSLLLGLWFYVGVFSYHGGSNDANYKHNPIGIEYHATERNYGLLLYDNSFYEETILVYTTGKVEDESWRINYMAGLVNGYCDEVLPVLLPFISWRYDSLIGDVGCLPNPQSNLTCVLMLKIKL